uniref:Uncharacterized protein n=1 Tax=Ixodes ricinus TaxID=34613 RepID=A0A6B0U6J0_IXORI
MKRPHWSTEGKLAPVLTCFLGCFSKSLLQRCTSGLWKQALSFQCSWTASWSSQVAYVYCLAVLRMRALWSRCSTARQLDV